MSTNKQLTKRKEVLWTRDLIEKFIDLLKENECLYDNKNKFYYNRMVRDEVSGYILQEMQKIKPNMRHGDIRRKMKVLRTQFAHENRMLSKAKAQGKDYEPRLWCYNKLLFLNKYSTSSTQLKLKNSITSHDENDSNMYSENSNIEYGDNVEIVEIYNNGEEDENNAANNQNEKFRSSNENIYEETMDVPETEAIDDKPTNECNKFDWLGDLVVSQIKDIGLEHRADFVWDVQCLVRKYVLKTKNTSAEKQSDEITKNLTFHKGSNISVNVNFL